MPSRSGFVGIIGKPNVGKSTILNFYVGTKIAITSPKPQTTRHRIAGIVTQPEAQVVFLDTPGLHQPRHALGRAMVRVIRSVLEEADVLLVVLDATSGIRAEDEWVFARTRSAKRPAILAINKIDLVKKPRLLPMIERATKTVPFVECVPISAKTGEQMEVVLNAIVARLPEGPCWYPSDSRTDQSLERLISEFIREQAIDATREEVPHAVAVRIDELTSSDRLTVVRATILVEREGQKAILVGRGGQMVKTIGQAARKELERLVRQQVHLDVWVKVAPHWRNDHTIIKQLGY